MNGMTKGLAVSFWAQYILDNFATVAEAVAVFEKGEFVIVSITSTKTKTERNPRLYPV